MGVGLPLMFGEATVLWGSLALPQGGLSRGCFVPSVNSRYALEAANQVGSTNL